MPSKLPTTSPTGAIQDDSFKYSPLEHVVELFVGFFQGLFQASPEGAYHWMANDETTEIYISDENPLRGDSIGARPAISCTRGPVQFFSLGLDDMLAYDQRTGTKQKSVLVPGTMTVNCCSRVAAESTRIAWICAEQLWLHRELLMKAGFFEIGRAPAIGAATAAGSIVVADQGDEWYVTPVTCPFQFYRTSQTSPLGQQIIKNVQIALRAKLQAVGCNAPATSGGVDLPVNIQGCPPASFAPAASDAYGGTPNPGYAPRLLPTVPHPLNPGQMVVVRSSKPNCAAVRPAGMGGRSIPIASTVVEESCGNPMDAHVTDTSTVKV